MNWALYVESIGNSSRDWLIFFYRQVKRALDYCLPKYEALCGTGENAGEGSLDE